MFIKSRNIVLAVPIFNATVGQVVSSFEFSLFPALYGALIAGRACSDDLSLARPSAADMLFQLIIFHRSVIKSRFDAKNT